MVRECCGPGYASPMDAFHNGTREKLLYLPCIQPPSSTKRDYLATIDCDPSSSQYSQVIHRLELGEPGEELHHTGWNACSSCHSDSNKTRRYLILPGLVSGNVFVVDTLNQRKPELHKMVKAIDIKRETNSSFPHTAHCLGSGEIMISHLGDANGKAQGNFVLLDENFDLKGNWGQEKTPFGYDFWYQPRHNVMLSTSWGEPNVICKGFNPAHVSEKYGCEIYVWDWKNRKLIDTLNLGPEGLIPLEVRFLHDPDKGIAFVGCALSSSVFKIAHVNGVWKAEKVIQVEPIDVEGWALPQLPGLITDILISLDDKYLYFSNWLQGDIRQYDITDPSHPKLVGRVFTGGVVREGSPFTFANKTIDSLSVPAKQRGGPQMIQLSLDGKRLYVTNSLFGKWDDQFYPEMVKNGSTLLMINVDNENGGLEVAQDFKVEFDVLAHEVRYPGGDCSSDIWI